jgi:phosphoglycerate dehydrogenase-like enzyme
MTYSRNQSHLNVVLWGRVAAYGVRLLRQHLSTRCRFFPFAEPPKEGALHKQLASADVVIGSSFTEPMARAATRLKLLHTPGAGVDSLSLRALSPRTTVANSYFHGLAIGEYVMMMVLALSRDLLKMDTRFRRGLWDASWIWGNPPAAEIQGKVLGLIGYGHIGREVATRARAFGMKLWVISAHPPKRRQKHVEFWETPDKVHTLLKASDYVALACPLNDQTRGLIGSREFSWMKKTAFLINVARGPVVDEEALYLALRTRRIQGAAVDVWYRYPTDKRPCAPSHFPFHKLDNIIITPHMSGWMKGTRENRFKLIAENIDRLAAGLRLRNVVQGPRRHPAIDTSGR